MVIERRRMDGLAFVRFFAFLEVFTCHVLWGGGAFGVSIFFIMSGFLSVYGHLNDEASTVSPLREGARNVWKKLLRLLPLYYIMDLIFIKADLARGTNPRLLQQVLAHLFLVQTWSPDVEIYFSLNGLGWFLSSIALSWFLFPVILRALRRLRGRFTHLILIAVILIVEVAAVRVLCFIDRRRIYLYYLTYICPVFRLGDFLVGCLLAMEFLHNKDHAAEYPLLFSVLETLAAVGAVGLIWISNHRHINHVWAFNLMWVFPAMVMVYLFAMGQGWISRMSRKGIIRVITQFSGYAYLIHHYIINKIWGTGMTTNKYIVAVLAFGISIVLSWIYDLVYRRLTEIIQKRKV